MKVKDVVPLFDVEPFLYYENDFIGSDDFINPNHFIYECEVKEIVIGRFEVSVHGTKKNKF